MEGILSGFFNVEQFVNEIRSQKAIWDMRCEDYSDKVKRSEAWTEIARKCYVDYDTMESAKQIAIVTELNKKWKNLRQCYKREHDSQTMPNSGSARKKKAQYIYFDILSFLAPVFSSKKKPSRIVNVEDGDEEGEVEKASSQDFRTDTSQKVHSSTTSSKLKRENKNPVAYVYQPLRSGFEERLASKKRKYKREEKDEDFYFLMSLLNYIHAIEGMNKLNMRSELLQVVTKYYDMSIHPQGFFPQNSQHALNNLAEHTDFSHLQNSCTPHLSSHSSSPEPQFPIATSPHPSSAHSSLSTSASLTSSSSDLELNK